MTSGRKAALKLVVDSEDSLSDPEPSPSYFTETPLSGQQLGHHSGLAGRSATADVPPPLVKLYFRPGLNTEALREGLTQAHKHTSTVAHVDLRTALQVDWKALAEPLLQLLVSDTLVSVIVPSFRLELVRGKCKGVLLDLLRQQTGSHVTVLGTKFKWSRFLDTNFITGKIKAGSSGSYSPTTGDSADIRSAMKVLKSFATDSEAPMLDEPEFRAAVCAAYKTMRKKGRFKRKQSRTLKRFQEAAWDDTSSPRAKRRKIQKNLPDFTQFSDTSSSDESPNETVQVEDVSNSGFTIEGFAAENCDQQGKPEPLVAVESADVLSASALKETSQSSASKSCAENANLAALTQPTSESPKGEIRKCYVCRDRFYTASKKRCTPATRNYTRMCVPCAELNWTKRHQTADLTGRVAVVTGGRIKIGYHIVLKLLRCGCRVVTTTRFPHNAARTFSRERDHLDWAARLSVYPLDLKNAEGIYKFISYLKRTVGHVDIVINNAAQTLRRPIDFYRHLLDYEQVSAHALPEAQRRLLVLQDATSRHLEPAACRDSPDDAETSTDVSRSTNEPDEPTLGQPSGASDPSPQLRAAAAREGAPIHQHTTTAATNQAGLSSTDSNSQDVKISTVPEPHLPSLACRLRERNPDAPAQTRTDPTTPRLQVTLWEREALFPAGRFDADGQQLDLRPTNSWRTVLDDVPVTELLEVLMVNTVAPFILNQELKPLLLRSPRTRKFIVNVSAMEGQFSRHAKTEFHPHTNMAKAALNMMTRTAALSYRNDCIFMTAVDTGWVTDERPAAMAQRERQRGFVLPLDAEDGASRVLDPIMSGVKSSHDPHCAVFLKDYRPYPW